MANENKVTANETNLLEMVRTPIEPVRATFAYRIATLFVACLMVLLPLIYLALIGLVGYGVYWHLTTNTGILSANVRGKAKAMAALIYIAPAIIGTILVAFMFKPLFARRSKRGEPKTLLRNEEPLLFKFVDGLCDAVGAPRPKAILLDDEVNAAAALTSSVWNPFRHDLTLIIGLPLAGGMTLRQLAGIMAHEFGHFSQGTAMRLHQLIYRINHWFAFVVYQRDSWDDQLEAWSKEGDLRITWVLWVARGMVWLTRQILKGLMYVGTAMSGRLSREMEYDADRHFVRFVGSDQFAESFGRLVELNVSSNMAFAELRSAYKERRLADNLFGLVAFHDENLSEADRRELRDQQLNEKTDWFDTHPCLADRIANIERENAPGVFLVEAPATVLFRDFEATCRAETLALYRRQLDEELPASQLASVQELIGRRKALQQQDAAAERVLADLYDYRWVLPLPDELQPSSDSLNEAIDQIRKLRSQISKMVDAHAKAIQDVWEQQSFEQEANLAELLLKEKITVGPTVFRVPLTTLDEVKAVRRQITTAKPRAYEPLAALLSELCNRLLVPLQLLGQPSIAARIPNGEALWSESQDLVRNLKQLQQLHDTFLQANDLRELLQDSFKQLEGNEESEAFRSCARKATQQGAAFLKTIKPALAAAPYPFEHAEGNVSIAHYLLPELPSSDNPGWVHAVLEKVMQDGFRMTTRAVTRLCVIVEEVETALGLPLGEKPELKA